MQRELHEIVRKSLEKAREHERTGNVGRAYAYYTAVAELSPQNRLDIEESFVTVLCAWGIQLEHQSRFKDVQLCYERSLDIYPGNTRMLNNYAAHLLRNDDPIKAVEYLKRALEINSNFLPAKRNLQNAFSMAVDRWHFAMLNDKNRNNAFNYAIQKQISAGYDTVLDVGTGTGLLSLYAKDAGAKKIYACECSEVISRIAANIFLENKAEEVKLFCKYSTELDVPEDIPERLKLVVTETFDAGLFGENVIPSLIHAHRNLLDLNGKIIPANATLYIAAIESEFIRYRSTVIFSKLKELSSLNFDNISVLPDDEFYDTEYLRNVKNKYLTEAHVLLTVDFNNLNELQELSRNGVKNIISTECKTNGTIDGLVTWFRLHLDDEIVINSAEGESCWQHAIFPVKPFTCKKGDVLSITSEMSNSKLKCSYSYNELQLNGCSHEFSYRISKEVIIFLNDFQYMQSLRDVAKSLRLRKIKTVLDTSPFPIYGFLLLKENRHVEMMYYTTSNMVLNQFIEQVAERNGVKEKVCCIQNYAEINHLFDCIYFHDFDMKGELKHCGEEENYDFYRCLLKPGGILLPEKIFLMGCLVHSNELLKMCSVNDCNLQRISREKDDEDVISNYKIAKHINQFKIDQIFDLNSSLYHCESMSDAKVLMEVTKSETLENIVNFGRVNVTRNGKAPNALLCWYKVVMTSSDSYETRRDRSFMNHTAIILEKDLKKVVSQDQEVRIKVLQFSGLVDVKVLEPS